MKFRDLGFTKEQMKKLCTIYDKLDVPPPSELIVQGSNFSWVRALEHGRVLLLPVDHGQVSSQNESFSISEEMETGQERSDESTVKSRRQEEEEGPTCLPESEINRIRSAAEDFRREEEMEEYLEYVEAGGKYFEETVLEDRVRQNLLLDTAQVIDNTVKFDVTCCNSADPGKTKFRSLDGAEKECKFFDPNNNWMLDIVLLASMSLFVDLHDSGERSSKQGELVRDLSQQGYDRRLVREELLKAMTLSDRSLKSAGLPSAELRFYSGRIRRDDTTIIVHSSGAMEHHVKGWNVFDVLIDRSRALEILYAWFVEKDVGKVALLLAISIEGSNSTYTRLFIDCCAVWVLHYVGNHQAGRCRAAGREGSKCPICEDLPLCYGMLRPFAMLREDGVCDWSETKCTIVDIMLSQAAASTTLRSEVGSVLDKLRLLHSRQSQLAAAGNSAGTLGVNVGLSKIGAVIVQGDMEDLDLLPIVSKEGVNIMKELHMTNEGYKFSFIMSVVEQFCGEQLGVQPNVDLSLGEPRTFGTVPARSDEVKSFVAMTAARPVGKRDKVMRMWHDGMYHLTVDKNGMSISKFPHWEGGITIINCGVHRGPKDEGLDLTLLRRMAEGKYGPHALEDIIEHHELGNVYVPRTSYTCFARDKQPRESPATIHLNSLGYINMKRSQRFATDGRRMWYNVTGQRYVRCKPVRGLWSFFHEEVCQRTERLIHVVPTRSIVISASWAHK